MFKSVKLNGSFDSFSIIIISVIHCFDQFSVMSPHGCILVPLIEKFGKYKPRHVYVSGQQLNRKFLNTSVIWLAAIGICIKGTCTLYAWWSRNLNILSWGTVDRSKLLLIYYTIITFWSHNKANKFTFFRSVWFYCKFITVVSEICNTIKNTFNFFLFSETDYRYVRYTIYIDMATRSRVAKCIRYIYMWYCMPGVPNSNLLYILDTFRGLFVSLTAGSDF